MKDGRSRSFHCCFSAGCRCQTWGASTPTRQQVPALHHRQATFTVAQHSRSYWGSVVAVPRAEVCATWNAQLCLPPTLSDLLSGDFHPEPNGWHRIRAHLFAPSLV